MANAIFDHLDIWRNGRRYHSTPGWVSLVEYEVKHTTVAQKSKNSTPRKQRHVNDA
ncbi:hypothetical protein GCM10009767_02640 [Kocuria aegyptia]|uniref:Transposase n=1 Tax=Kocuria aegyptia TaxID=330943 RepID=A0ABN2K3J4_9MICC